MCHLLYLIFRCDRKFGIGKKVFATKHSPDRLLSELHIKRRGCSSLLAWLVLSLLHAIPRELAGLFLFRTPFLALFLFRAPFLAGSSSGLRHFPRQSSLHRRFVLLPDAIRCRFFAIFHSFVPDRGNLYSRNGTCFSVLP